MTPERRAPGSRKAPRMATPRGTSASGRNASPSASSDWNPASGIVDQMLAYSDWWNIRIPKGNGSSRQMPKSDRI
jgi:hypothetical protein